MLIFPSLPMPCRRLSILFSSLFSRHFISAGHTPLFTPLISLFLMPLHYFEIDYFLAQRRHD